MPKSKRNKVVTLSKTTKKGKVGKETMYAEVRACAEQYPRVFVFEVFNSRTPLLQELRVAFANSRFFFAKNKVVAAALGTGAEDEQQPGQHRIARYVRGVCGVLFTHRPYDDVVKFLAAYSVKEFARTGMVAPRTVELKAGPMAHLDHPLEPRLRQLGLPTQLKNGVINLLGDYTLCEEGKPISSERADLLKLFGHKLAEFRLLLRASWDKDADGDAIHEFNV